MSGSDYELVRPLSAGGMGEVYVARKTGTVGFEKLVALKLLLPHLVRAPDQLERFYNEARLAARMHHPNIVEVFDVGELRGRPFIAMQLVDGVTLERLIREAARAGRSMPLAILNAIAVSLLEALHYAHTLADASGKPLEVIHRDVTPGNVLMARSGAVLLTDFGIARVGGIVRTEPGVVRGKLAYLSPEQILENAPLDARSDLFSAAVTLFEAATGRHPFRRQTDGATLHAVATTEAPSLLEFRPDLPPSSVAAFERGLAQLPGDRFESARAFREALVSGPIASAPEVAGWIDALCPRDPEKPEPVETPTASLVAAAVPLDRAALADPPRVTVTLERPKRGRWVAAVVGVVALGIAAFALVRSDSGRPPVTAVEPPPSPPIDAPGSVNTAATPAPEPELSPVVPEPAVRPPVPIRAAPALASKKPKLGYLSADATPWADVLLGSELIDRTPFIRYPLQVGRHTLTFRGPSGEVLQRRVVVTENATTSVRVEFKQ